MFATLDKVVNGISEGMQRRRQKGILRDVESFTEDVYYQCKFSNDSDKGETLSQADYFKNLQTHLKKTDWMKLIGYDADFWEHPETRNIMKTKNRSNAVIECIIPGETNIIPELRNVKRLPFTMPFGMMQLRANKGDIYTEYKGKELLGFSRTIYGVHNNKLSSAYPGEKHVPFRVIVLQSRPPAECLEFKYDIDWFYDLMKEPRSSQTPQSQESLGRYQTLFL